MTIDHVEVVEGWTVDGTVRIEPGQVLMGEILGDTFLFPLTIDNRRVECLEFFSSKRIILILEGLKLS